MENNVVEFIDEIEPSKGEKFKRWCVETYQRGKSFVLEHGKETVAIAATVTGIAVTAYKTFKPTVYEQERKRIDRTYYDPSTGLHWELKRKLTNNEREELDQRRRNGEAVGNILRDMGVAKR